MKNKNSTKNEREREREREIKICVGKICVEYERVENL